MGLSQVRRVLTGQEPWPWKYRVVENLRTVDGDTFDMRLHRRAEMGFNINLDMTYAARFRLYPIDVVESNEAKGSAATRFADWWIADAIRKDLLIGITFKSEGLVPDGAFGRWLIELMRLDDHTVLSDVMVQAGFLKPKMTGDVSAG